MITDWSKIEVGMIIYECDGVFGNVEFVVLTAPEIVDGYYSFTGRYADSDAVETFGYRIGYEGYMPHLYTYPAYTEVK